MRSSFVDMINKGVVAARAGNPAYARQFFIEAIRIQPKDPRGWYYYSIVAPNQDEKRKALLTVLKLDPRHRRARAKLLDMRRRAQEAATIPQPSQIAPPPLEDDTDLESLPLPDPFDDDAFPEPEDLFEPDPFLEQAIRVLGTDAPLPEPPAPIDFNAPTPPAPRRQPTAPTPRPRQGIGWFSAFLLMVLFVAIVVVAYALLV